MNGSTEEDRQTLERIQNGDENAMALLYDRHAGVVYTTALRLLHNPAQAEQVLSDIFIEVWRNPSRFCGASCLSLALAVMARNRALAVLTPKPSAALDLIPLPIASIDTPIPPLHN